MLTQLRFIQWTGSHVEEHNAMQGLETMLKIGMQRKVSSQFVTSNLVDNFQNHSAFELCWKFQKTKSLVLDPDQCYNRHAFSILQSKLAYLFGPAVFWQMFAV